MRIISNFKDYYDSIMGIGQDQTLVYKRYPEEVKLKPGEYRGLFTGGYYRADWNEYFTTDQYTVWFCGKVYNAVTFQTSDRRTTLARCYRVEEVDTFVRKYYPASWDHYAAKGYIRKSLWPTLLQRHLFESIFGSKPFHHDRLRELAEKKQCPIIVVHGVNYHSKKQGLLTYNAQLKGLEFIRVFDPYSAFQEIAMWLGNQAQPRKPIPEIPDETMAEIKGFDKWSFRRPPGEKKKKKGKS